MEAKKVLLVKYGEISLRKGNRAFFEHQLLDAIRYNIKSINNGNIIVKREQGRFLIEHANGDLDVDQVLPLIKCIFGITGFCRAIKISTRKIDEMRTIALNFFRESMSHLPTPPATFRIETKRSDKNFPLTSNATSSAIGEEIFESDLGLAVDLKNPDIILWAEIRNHVYFYIDSEPGYGGLPYGGSGSSVLLLSGGFDSPVAGFLAARRGVKITPIYFHSPPFVSERAADKVRDLTAQLCKFIGTTNLHIIPFTDVQIYLRDNVHPEKLTIFLKRAMLRISTIIAEKEKAQCIVTGDSVGQVASQTIQSIAAVNSAASLPILRPLCTMDKQEIIDIAKSIETFDISVRPYEDCCTIFVAKHPESKPNVKIIERIEAEISEGLMPLIQKAAEDTRVEKIFLGGVTLP